MHPDAMLPIFESLAHYLPEKIRFADSKNCCTCEHREIAKTGCFSRFASSEKGLKMLCPVDPQHFAGLVNAPDREKVSQPSIAAGTSTVDIWTKIFPVFISQLALFKQLVVKPPTFIQLGLQHPGLLFSGTQSKLK